MAAYDSLPFLTTDGGLSTYSCNVSATGVREHIEDDGNDNKKNNNQIRIVSLSCAKDEGLGQTYDLIYEKKQHFQ